MGLRRAWAPSLGSALLAAHPGGAFAIAEQHVEDRIGEARAPTPPVAQEGSWMIVPIPVANPTVGNGLQLATLYMHPKALWRETAPSSTSGALLMATDAGARMAAVFHDGSFAEDLLRLSAFAGRGKFKLKFYGSGVIADAQPLPYEMSGTMAQLRAEGRLPGTEHWFGGLTYQYLDSTLTLLTAELVPGLPELPVKFRNAALGPHVTYDSRDSNYFPLSGQYARARWLNYAPRWGGDFAFDKGDVYYNLYRRTGKTSVFGFRARLQTASADTPFYELATLDMRGFSRDRYRDHYTLSVTGEWRHKFTARWGMMAFAEAGRFAPEMNKLSGARTITSYGGGVRWQASEDRDLHVGMDFAVSSDDSAVFVQIGEKF